METEPRLSHEGAAKRKGRQTDMLNLEPPHHTPTLREADPRHEAANLTDGCQRNREQELVCSNCLNPQGGRRNRDRLIALILIQGPGACSVDLALVAETFGGL